MLKLRELRVENNLLQSELAKQMNKSAVCIGDWERGRCEPSIEDLLKLAQIFKVSVDYILGNENEFGTIKTSVDANYSMQEQRIIKIYRKLSPRDKNLVDGIFERFDDQL